MGGAAGAGAGATDCPACCGVMPVELVIPNEGFSKSCTWRMSLMALLKFAPTRSILLTKAIRGTLYLVA